MARNLYAFTDALQAQPVIAAAKNETGLRHALETECAAVFILYGSILTIPDLVSQVKAANRFALVHADLIEGLTGKDISVDFLARNTKADGIISTRPNMICRAKELDLLAIQRFFMLDSLALENIVRQSFHADMVDILPGVMPQIIHRLTKRLSQNIIASGLLVDKADVMAALSAGAVAVSTTCEELWYV